MSESTVPRLLDEQTRPAAEGRWPWRRVSRRALASYGLALLAVAAAALARLALTSRFGGGDSPLLLFYAAVGVAACYGGLWPGLLATGLSALIGASLFMERNGWQIQSVPDQVRLAVFLTGGGLTSALAEVVLASRRRVATLLGNMPDACSGFDRSWRYTYVNTRWEELFGMTAAQAVGNLFWDAFPELLGTEVERQYRRVMTERVPLAFEAFAPHARRWVEIRVYPTDEGIAAHIRDISERKQAEQALRASERRYRALIRATPSAIWTYGSVEDATDGPTWWRTLTGQTAEQSAGWGWLDVVHPDDQYRVRQAWLHAQEHNTLYEVEYRVRATSGEYRRIAARGVPLLDEAGQLDEWIGTMADVQGREDAAVALRVAEERLRLAIDAGGMATWDWDLRTGKIAWSDSHFRLFGYQPSPGGEASFEMWRDKVHPEDHHRVLGDIEAARRDRVRYSTEYRVCRDGGEITWVASCGQFFFDSFGEAFRMVGVVSDVTDRHRFTDELERRVAARTAELARSEAALRESETRFRTLFEHSPVAVWEEDFTSLALWFTDLRVAGVTDLRRWLADHPDEAHKALTRIRVLDVNREAAAQNGAADKHQLMENLPSLFTERGFQAFIEELVLLYEGKRSMELGTSARRLDGKVAEIVMRLQVPGGDETPDWGRVIVTGTDVTERARVEDELRRARVAAEAASKAKSEFLANMSHEIRTPMNGVLGMTELLLDTNLMPEQRGYLLTAKQSAESLLAILDDILDFSKIEAGKLELTPEVFRPRDGLADLLRALEPQARRKRLRLEAHVADEVPDACVGDLGRLRQVLINLIGNAIKFTERGAVVVRVSGEGGAEPTLTFEVSDTGIGIPGEKLAAIFQPFEQVESSMTRRFGGTGLGLSISARLVELMGGRIWGESELGKGSIFRFTVRVGAAPAAAASPLRSQSAPPQVLRVLLAEDNPINQRVALGMLEMLGHETTVVTNGREALAELARATFDVVLMDVQMPEMDGIEATERIRKLEAASGRHTQVVAVTAHAMKGDRERFLAAGMDDYVTKPVRFDDLRRALGGGPAVTVPNEQAMKTMDLLDSDALLGRAGGRADIAARVLAMLPTESARMLSELQDAVRLSDAGRATRVGHQLKGMLGNLSAGAAEAAARAVEEAGKRGDRPELERASQVLEGEVTRLLPEAAALRERLLRGGQANAGV